ncbi:chromosome segregation ATPase [Mycoplasmopsis californica HAZ160_1]|uniref:Chromosome partition protein Smc n=1 Tax=Mycoplasmopsis californica HAZ160_1 TaxID=1397850 RepID=A0AAT9F8I3_9BACT|nr:AAA family ATPase [Mycoplasmopsis californica]BAP01213.1 chromosome segregation ATPase [Mycoplasmopsis californica HAZ160_1]BBG41084.1 chromosome segregation ATPase [Mycoplasmopsis californica]BBG41677.1 chromosome segregation ATPase [Mycoplasmopsis californica]BBG42271.1 chromosome segregation ATPase [Mycoplasmopsis californica]BBG42848.1 chromosome segregation ATPase [Mycoplasmopsis californica]
MKLIKVEAHGFKSFADPVALSFDGGVAGIVGPNGSGKSNINDAIRWVLGERSAKELRGDKMDDVIFQGSQTMKAMNRAEVTLTFDNKNGNNSIPHEIFTISRVLERGAGGNKYYLNGEECRQKDILEIAMESGIGKSSLAIISQGTVSDIAQSTPEQRKAIFEEAAGVSKYKFKKKEAISKLAKTQEGLEKIEITIKEIDRKLGPLRKQAEKATIYIQKAEELKQVEIGLLVDNIKTFGEKYEALSAELEGVEETKAAIEQRIAITKTKISQSTLFKSEAEAKIEKLQVELNELQKRLDNIQNVLNQESAREQLIAQGDIEASPTQRIEAYQKLAKAQAKELNIVNNSIIVLKQRIQEVSNSITTSESKINELQIKEQNTATQLTKVQTTITILNDHKESGTLIFDGTKTIANNRAFFGKPLKGTVAELIKVEPEYLRAIDTVLASAAQHWIVDKPETAVKAVNFLKSNNGGRATFIPLSTIQPKSVRDDHLLGIQGHPGFIAVASDLVSCEHQYDVVKKFLLGNIIVASDIDQANKISHILDRRYMIVTLDGDTIRPGGVIVGGVKEKKESLIGFDDKIKRLKELLPGIQSQLQFAQSQLIEARNIRKQHYAILEELKTTLQVEANKRNAIQAKIDEFNIKLQNLNAEVVKLDSDEAKQDKNSKTNDLQSLQIRKTEIETELSALLKQTKVINAELTNLNLAKDDDISSMNNLSHSYAQKLSDKTKSELIVSQSRERLAAQYKLTFESAVLEHKLNMPHEVAQEIVRDLREEIDKLGNVNLESLEALKEEEERFNKYDNGFKELSQAKATLEKAIADIDKVIVTRLTNIVNDVNTPFNEVFGTMMGGGKAELYWSNPDDILESGIEIKAQPPGKNIANLKLFSGGEKSLIAISLLFAILKARPLPLCILDEVEAALDEANVVRYAEYLQELKAKTQFLVITHRHGTMSRVDALFGATMQNRGVTTFFSLELAEAKKMVKDEQKEINFNSQPAE